ncbi:TetR/AcrR family transcriptional regulator [Caballeronia sp. 15715]|uniref:TetR/AcrR family transcriptional regulator n=1 Tax=Caballeronia sp. 15715 TaxID=3391030 RepID=UPI0039E312F8
MRYSATHKQETREKLLDSSRAIAKKGGFDSTGVDALMSAIGLTGGAFYSHFASKGELFAALVEREVENSSKMLAGDETSTPDHVAKCIRNYLSTFHALHPEIGCGLTTLGPEIARSSPQVRATAEASLKKTQRSWAERMDGDGDKAWSLLAQCIGTIVMARVVESERTRQEILASSRRFVEKTQQS